MLVSAAGRTRRFPRGRANARCRRDLAVKARIWEGPFSTPKQPLSMHTTTRELPRWFSAQRRSVVGCRRSARDAGVGPTTSDLSALAALEDDAMWSGFWDWVARERIAEGLAGR